MARTLEQAETQLAFLAEQNRQLAAELEALQKQSPALEKAVKDARAQQASAEKNIEGLKSKLTFAEKQNAELSTANKAFAAQVARLSKQVEKSPFNPLTVEEASLLFDGVLGAFRTSKTFEVRNASLNLKLATAKVGDIAVLMLPDPKSVDPATLHELKLELSTAARAEVTTAAPPRPAPVEPVIGRTTKPPAKSPSRNRK